MMSRARSTASTGPSMRSLACALLLSLPSSAMVACSSGHAEHHTEEAHHPVVLTNPAVMDFPTSEEYVSQIHSRRHVEIRALDEGYLRAIPVQEGQAVTQGQLMFKLLPVVYRARLDSHRAELHLAEIRVRNARQLFEQEAIVRLVFIQAANDIIPVLPRVRLGPVALEAVGFGIANQIEPVAPPPLAVLRHFEQPVDQPPPGIGLRVVDKRLDLGR